MTDVDTPTSAPSGWFRPALAACAAALALGLAACGSSDTDDSGGATAASATPAADTAGFVGGEPEPGTEIPSASVKFGMRPYADNAFYYLGIENGFYEDNGISIEPPPYGIKNNENAISQMLNGTVDIQAMYGPSLIPTYKTDQSLKQIMFTDYFNGFALLAPGDMNLKTVSEYVDEGLPFEEAMKRTLEPMQDKELVVAPLLDGREFVKQSFELAGLPQPKLKIMDDPQSLIAARAGQIEFAVPTGAPTTLQFEREGWTALVTPWDIIDNVEGAAQAEAAGLAGTVGLASNETYINENPNTVLRFVSATYRLIDEIERDPAILDEYAPYLNSLTGLELTGEDLAELFDRYNPLTDFAFGETYCRDESALLHYENAYGGLIDAYVGQGAIDEGAVTPDDVIWACGVWNQLKDYQEQTDAIFAEAEGADLSGEKAQLMERARELYDQFNFLDAYRYASEAMA